MQVLAFSTPVRPGWRWRIVNYAGEMIEESFDAFPTIGTAVDEGRRRLGEMDTEDHSVRQRPAFRGWRRTR